MGEGRSEVSPREAVLLRKTVLVAPRGAVLTTGQTLRWKDTPASERGFAQGWHFGLEYSVCW